MTFVPAMTIFRRREALIGLMALTICLTFLSFSKHPSVATVRAIPNTISLLYNKAQHPEIIQTDHSRDPLEVLSQLYEDERVSLLSGYDQAATEALVRTPQGALNPDFNSYISRLEGFIDTYFNHSIYHQPLTNSLSRLVSAKPPVEESEFKKWVFSFDKDGRQGAPEWFDYWEKRLEPHGWKVEVGDDSGMENWFEECAGAMQDMGVLEEEDVGYSGQDRWNEMWHGLGRPVLKSDILRYLMSLVKGGLYTDSDTAPLSDINLWGTHANVLTPRGLSALQRAMRHLDPTHPSYAHNIPTASSSLSELDYDDEGVEAAGHRVAEQDLDFASNPVKEVSRGINNPRVSLVVSVEYDTHHGRQDPRFGYTRDLQIVQWTFMSKPFHPVFMDILETATSEIMRRRDAGEKHNSWQSILDVTGPGPFTDAVLRYLLVQYGVTPNELLGMEDGALIGDVLILPLHAFGSFPGGEEDWNAHDPSTRCTSHGFKGRWKGDLNFDRKRSLPPSEGFQPTFKRR